MLSLCLWERGNELFGEQRGTEVMAMQCPQKLMYFLSSLGCFRSALMIAAVAANMNVIRLLLQHGADPSQADCFGSAAMRYARLSQYAE